MTGRREPWGRQAHPSQRAATERFWREMANTRKVGRLERLVIRARVAWMCRRWWR